MSPQRFLGYFIAALHHKTLPDILQIRLFVFEDTASPEILLSYAASDRLCIVEFKIPNETIKSHRCHYTCQETCGIQHSTHSHIHKRTHSKGQHNHQQLKPAIKLHSFQDHHFQDYSSQNKSFQDHLPQKMTYQEHSSKNNHSWTILSKNHHPVSILHKNSYCRTIFHQKHHTRTILHKNNHFSTISPQIMFAIL